MSTEAHRVEVALPVSGPGGKVTIDGKPLRGVRYVRIEAAVDDVTEITVTFFAHVNVTAAHQEAA